MEIIISLIILANVEVMRIYYSTLIGIVINIKVWLLLNRFMNVKETFQSREGLCFI